MYIRVGDYHLIPPSSQQPIVTARRSNDCPKHCSPDLSDDGHTLFVGRGALKVPLLLDGVTSYFPSFKPMVDEISRYPDYNYSKLTASFPEWDPTSDNRARKKQEETVKWHLKN